MDNEHTGVPYARRSGPQYGLIETTSACANGLSRELDFCFVVQRVKDNAGSIVKNMVYSLA